MDQCSADDGRSDSYLRLEIIWLLVVSHVESDLQVVEAIVSAVAGAVVDYDVDRIVAIKKAPRLPDKAGVGIRRSITAIGNFGACFRSNHLAISTSVVLVMLLHVIGCCCDCERTGFTNCC